MAFKFRKWEAKIVLAFLFLGHLIKRLLFFWQRRPGLTSFQENFREDSIFNVSEAERKGLPQFQKCLNCSLCTLSCSAVIDGSAPNGFEPKTIPLSLLRSEHEVEYLLEEWLPCQNCGQCVAECPNHLPLHDAVKLVVARRGKAG